MEPTESTDQCENDNSATTNPLVHAQIINPLTVQAAEGKDEIDYDALINDFGTKRITPELIERFEKVTGKRAHPLLRRGLYFSHRDLEMILDTYEKGEPFFLYTGRGPSSDALHLGHMIPFIFTQYLQEAFNVPLVIQLTDDEKFFFNKMLTLNETRRLARSNAKDIIAFGFDITKTFIFQDTHYIGEMYQNIAEIQKRVTYNNVKNLLGFTDSTNCGTVAYPAIQAAPSFASSFKKVFGGKQLKCLVPCAIDQDPYFRMTRDVANGMNEEKPALIHCKFVAGLGGAGSKMSSSDPTSAIFVHDTPKQIEKKIKKYAKSGGGEDIELHRKHGGDLDVDVSYQYLRFFMDDDEELDRIARDYSNGDLSTGALKQRLINVLQPMIANFQKNRNEVTEDMVDTFMAIRKLEI